MTLGPTNDHRPGQSRNVRFLGFRDIVAFRDVSKISTLSLNKANEPAWIVTGISDICKYLPFPVLCDHNTVQGHLMSPAVKKVKPKKSGFRAVIYVLRSDFRKQREKGAKNTF